MRRTLLASAAALTVLTLAGPATAGGLALEDDEKHICVITNSEKNQGYCVKTYGVHLPKLP